MKMSEMVKGNEQKPVEEKKSSPKKANPVMNYVLGIGALLLSIVLIVLLYWAVDTILLKFLGAALLWVGQLLAKFGEALTSWSVALNDFKAAVTAYTGWRKVLAWVVAASVVGAVQVFFNNKFNKCYKNRIRKKNAVKAENANKA